MDETTRSGYKSYQVKLFQPIMSLDLSKQIRSNHKTDGSYTMLDAKPYDGSVELGRAEVSLYALKQLMGKIKFTTKHDAIAYGQGIKNLVYGLKRYTPSGADLDRVDINLRGGDVEGYYIEFTMIHANEEARI